MEISDKRLIYIDNLRIFLIALVVLIHIGTAYGPIGFWYYFERTGLPSTYILAFLVSVSQAFLIGLFFMVSAFFTPASYNKKGPDAFIRGRLKRLGIPLLFYITVIGPYLSFLGHQALSPDRINFFYFYYEEIIKGAHIDTGPLWFVQALLFFDITYSIIRVIMERVSKKSRGPVLQFPSNRTIFTVILLLASATFLLRIWSPIGTAVSNLGLSWLLQYIFLFIIGIVAYHNKWFEMITYKIAIFWFNITMAAVLSWPLIAIWGKAFNGNIMLLGGGLHWQSFIYSLWEIIVGMGIPISIIYLFRQKAGRQNKLFGRLSKGAYTAFIIHQIVIVLLLYIFREVSLHPLIKFLAIAMTGIPLCFLIGILIIKIPFLKKIL